MLEDFLVENVWLALLVYIVLYVSDYLLTIVSAQKSAETLDEFTSREGSFELTPFYEGDVDALRWFSPRMVLIVTLQCGVMLLFWWLTRSTGDDEVFAFVLGAFFLLEVVVHMRHSRNLAAYHYGRRGGLSGRLERARWLMLRLSAVDMAGYVALFVLVFLLTGSWFVLGGAAGCLVTAVKQAHWADLALMAKEKAQAAAEGFEVREA